MAVKPEEVFDLMEAAYRHGVLDKSNVVINDALEELFLITDLNFEDLLNRADATQKSTVDKLDKMVGRSAPLIKHMGSDRMMALTSKILDFTIIRNLIKVSLQKAVLRGFEGYLQSPETVGERIKLSRMALKGEIGLAGK